jgi:hypothetical protein
MGRNGEMADLGLCTLGTLSATGMGVAVAMVLGFAHPSLADQPPSPPTLARALANPAWTGSLRGQLHGRVEVVLGDENLLRHGDNIVVQAVASAAIDCGFSWVGKNSADTDRLVWIVPIAHPTNDDVALKLKGLSKELGNELGSSLDDIARGVMDQLRERGLSTSVVTGQPNAAEKSLTIVFFDRDKLRTDNTDAVINFAIFSGLVGTTIYNLPVDNNVFSYLFGGGGLDDVAGDNAGRYAKLCRALPVVRAVCGGYAGPSQPREDIQQHLSQLIEACQPGSAHVAAFMNLDNEIQRARESEFNDR